MQVITSRSLKASTSLRNRRVFPEKSDCDGLALKASGNVLLTGFRLPVAITRVSAEGNELEQMLTLASSTTQLRFGGADLCDYCADIARAVLFCASDMSAFMTGSTLLVDAGETA